MAQTATNRSNLAAIRTAIATLRTNADRADASQSQLHKLAKALERELDYFAKSIPQ